LFDGRHLGSLVRLARSRDRVEGGLGGFHGCAGRASDVTRMGEATEMPEVRIHTHRDGKTMPTAVNDTTCGPPKRIALM
jgi:hypothetical protein